MTSHFVITSVTSKMTSKAVLLPIFVTFLLAGAIFFTAGNTTVFHNSLLQYTPDLLTINIVNFFGLVNFLLLTILLLVCSKNTVDLVNYPGLVNFLLLTKKFTKSGVYCTILITKVNSY